MKKKKKTKFYELKVHLGLFIFHGYLIPHPFWRWGFGATHRERERERDKRVRENELKTSNSKRAMVDTKMKLRSLTFWLP